MIRIGFFGSDSTHTEALGKRINAADGAYRDRARVTAIWGEDGAQTAAKAKLLGIDRVAARIEEALDDIDLAMVIGRFGESHYRPASLAIERGIPVFVDKPFTVSSDEAQRLAALGRQRGVGVCSGSPLRFARETLELQQAVDAAPRDWVTMVATVPASCTDLGPDPRLDSAFFYGIHGLEVLLQLAGHDIARISTHYGGSVITSHIELNDGRTVAFQLVRDAAELYAIDVYFRDRCLRREVTLDGSYYDAMVDFIVNRFYGRGETIPMESTLQAVSLLEAIDRNDPQKKQ